MPGAGAWRCSHCGVSWPYSRDYRQCPECQDTCFHIDDTPLDIDEAESRRKTAAFDRFYAKREALALLNAAAEIAKLPEATVRRPLIMRWDRGFE